MTTKSDCECDVGSPTLNIFGHTCARPDQRDHGCCSTTLQWSELTEGPSNSARRQCVCSGTNTQQVIPEKTDTVSFRWKKRCKSILCFAWTSCIYVALIYILIYQSCIRRRLAHLEESKEFLPSFTEESIAKTFNMELLRQTISEEMKTVRRMHTCMACQLIRFL